MCKCFGEICVLMFYSSERTKESGLPEGTSVRDITKNN